MLFSREDAGTLYFTTHYACRHFGADTSIDSFLICFFYIFFIYFFVVFRCQNWKKHENSSSVIKLACSCHFGGLRTDFLPLGSVFSAPFVGPGAPQGLPWGPRARPQTGPNGVQEAPSEKLGSLFSLFWGLKASQDPSGSHFIWILMIFWRFTRQK